MIKSMILIIVSSLLLFGCTGTKSFEGRIGLIEENYFYVDCTKAVNKGEENVKDIGYPCKVQITDKTTLSNENGSQLSADDFSEGTYVRVITTEPKYISESNESRELVASEIVLINK
jgi:hypothetical protein